MFVGKRIIIVSHIINFRGQWPRSKALEIAMKNQKSPQNAPKGQIAKNIATRLKNRKIGDKSPHLATLTLGFAAAAPAQASSAVTAKTSL